MEFIQIWTKIFLEAWRERDKKALERILKDGSEYFKTVSEDHKEAALDIIFNKEEGLLKFFEAQILVCIEEMLNGPLEEAFNTLQFIIEFFIRVYEPFFMQTWNICYNFLCVSIHMPVKIAAAETFAKLIELFNKSDLNYLNEILIDWKDDDVVWFIVFDAIIKYRRKNINHDLYITICHQLLLDLNKECFQTQRTQKKEYIEIYLRCLSSMMINKFIPFIVEERDVYTIIYKILKLLCDTTQTQKILTHILHIINNDIEKFSTYIYQDYKDWHRLLNYMCNDNSDIIAFNALRSFYKVIAPALLCKGNENDFQHFRDYFKTTLSNTELPTCKIYAVACGLGEFHDLYKKYLRSGMSDMIQQFIAHSLSVFTKKISTGKNFKALPYYVQVFSELLKHITNMSLHYLNLLEKFCVFIIEKFPYLDMENHNILIDSIKVTFINVKQFEENFQRDFHLLFYKGLLWSCSYSLSDDIKLQQDIQNLTELPINLKNYLPMWHSFFKTDNCDQNFAVKMFSEFLQATTHFLDSLNLNIKSQKNISLLYSYSYMKADNEEDYQYFVNFVDLFASILEEIDVLLLESQVEKLLELLIKYSYKYPITSGFYKLIRAIFLKLNDYKFKVNFDKTISKFISQYFFDISKHIHRFSRELQISCIYLILSAPLHFIDSILDETIPVFIIAFQIGLCNFSLAFETMNTLENWTKESPSQNLNHFYEQVVFYTEPYLRIKRRYENFNNIGKMKEKDTYNIISNDNIGLETLQKKILLFYGTLENNIVVDLIHKKSLETDVIWLKNETLAFQLNFSDINLNIDLDKFISNIIESIKNKDSRVKFSACKLLHRKFMLILGKNLIDQYNSKNLFLLFLKLGCDSDELVRDIYHPLVQQLNFYLSSRSKIRTETCQNYLDVIFEGLTEDCNPSLRDYSYSCIKQFMQSANGHNTSDFLIDSTFISQVINLALSSLKNKRLAAAIVFNNLCSNISLSRSVVNIYGLEFLYVFIKCLEDEGDHRYTEEIYEAIKNVEMAIQKYSQILDIKSIERKKLPGIFDETLTGAGMWLLNECGSLNVQYREKCMKLLESFFILLFKCDSIKQIISSCEIDFINNMVLTNLEGDLKYITINSIKAFMRSLDLYNWILYNKILEPETIVLQTSPDEENIFFKFFNNFISVIITNNIEEMVTKSTNSPNEAQELICLIDLTIMRIFKFITTILFLKGKDSIEIFKIFWNDDLCLLILRFILYPYEIGLTVKTVQTIYVKKVEDILQIFVDKLPGTYLSELMEHLIKNIKESLKKSTDIFNCNFDKDYFYSYTVFLQSATMVKRFLVLDFEKQLELPVEFVKGKMADISQYFCKVNCMQKPIQLRTIDYLKEIMNFFLLEYNPEVVEALIVLSLESRQSTTPDGSKQPLCKQFFETFKWSICRCMLLQPQVTLKLLQQIEPASLYSTFYFITELLKFSQLSPSSNGISFAKYVFEKCTNFAGHILFDHEDLRLKLFEINRLAVKVVFQHSPENTSPEDVLPKCMYTWILSMFAKAKHMPAQKYALMEAFLACLLEEKNRAHVDKIFDNLRTTQDAHLWLTSLELDETRSSALQCLFVIFDVLHDTKSVYIYERLVKYAAGACKLFSRQVMREQVQKFFRTAPETNSEAALNTTFEMFIDLSSYTPDERHDVLVYFLLPALESCSTKVLAKFIKPKIDKLCEFAVEKLDESDVTQRQHTLVTKICAFGLFELTYGRIFNLLRGARTAADAREQLYDFLSKELVEMRNNHSKYAEEKEFWRLAQCAALNCIVAIYCATGKKQVYLCLFTEDRNKGQLIWEQIVDCERKYELEHYPDNFVERPINVATSKEEMQMRLQHKVGASYYRQLDPDERHRRADPMDTRHVVRLDEDQLNEHECMAMLVGVITLFFHRKATRRNEHLPRHDDEDLLDDDMPHWVQGIRGAFATSEDNVRLFLLKLISNAKEIFICFISSFFVPLVVAVKVYLSRNNLNYVVRQVMNFLLESEHQLRTETEKNMVQELLVVLIERTTNEQDQHIYEENLKLIEALVAIWKLHLQLPSILLDTIKSNTALATAIMSIFAREDVDLKTLAMDDTYHRFTRKEMFTWQTGLAPQVFEIIGKTLDQDYVSEDIKKLTLKQDLFYLFKDMFRYNPDFCTRMVYLVFKGYEKLADYEYLYRFIDPNKVTDDERLTECYKIFLSTANYLTSSDVSNNVHYIGLMRVLRDRIVPCIKTAIMAFQKLINVLTVKDLTEFADLAEEYAKGEMLREYKIMALQCFMKIFERFTGVEKLSKDESLLRDKCQKILIAGTADASNEIQNFVLSFWTEKMIWPADSAKRLLSTLVLYSHEVDTYFAQFLCLMLLNMANLAPNNQRVLFEGLEGQTFSTKKTGKKTGNSRYDCINRWKTPLFVSSVCGALDRADFAGTLPKVIDQIRGSNKPVCYGQTSEQSECGGSRQSCAPSSVKLLPKEVPGPTCAQDFFKLLLNERFQREHDIKPDSKSTVARYPDVEISQADVVEAFEQLARRDRQFAGDLAAAIITGFIENLKTQVPDESLKNDSSQDRSLKNAYLKRRRKRNWRKKFSRDSNKKGVDLLDQLTDALKDMCEEAMQTTGAFAPVAMKILSLAIDVKFNADTVTRAAKLIGEQALGISILEKNTISCHKQYYRSQDAIATIVEGRTTKISILHPVQLADLYRSIDEYDVVKSIFSNWVKPEDLKGLRNGSLAQAEEDWLAASHAYNTGYKSEENKNKYLKHYCLEGMFKCYSELSDWSKINEKIAEIVQKGHIKKKRHSIWNSSFLLPWAIKSEVQTIVRYIAMNKLDRKRATCVDIDDRMQKEGTAVTKPFGDQLSIFYLTYQAYHDQTYYLRSFHCLKSYLEDTRARWLQTSYLDELSKSRILGRLKRIVDLDAYHRMLWSKSDDPRPEKDPQSDGSSSIEMHHMDERINLRLAANPGYPKANNPKPVDMLAVKELMSYWKKNSPRSDDDVTPWSEIVDCRLAFASVLKNYFTALPNDSCMKKKLMLAIMEERLNMGNVAIEHKKKAVAEIYISFIPNIQSNFTDSHLNNLIYKQKLLDSRYTFLSGKINSCSENTIQHYVNSWKIANGILNNGDIEFPVKIETMRHITDVISTIQNLIVNNEECFRYITQNEYIRSTLNVTDISQIVDAIDKYGYNVFKELCDKGSNEDLANNYTLLAAHCLEWKSKLPRQSVEFDKAFITAVLTAMKLGSTKALRYFSCLLNPLIYKDLSQNENLLSDLQNIPTWMFLPVQELIVWQLSTPLKLMVVPIIQKLANEYPNAIVYSLRGCYETNPEICNDLPIDELYHKIFIKPNLDNYFKAIEYLCQPENYLEYYLLKSLHSANNTVQFFIAMDHFFQKIHFTHGPFEKKKICLCSASFLKIIIKCKMDLENLKTVNNYEVLTSSINKMCSELNTTMKQRLKEDKGVESSQLQNYSSYLAQFSQINEAMGIEIPGQYSQASKPLPRHHVQILKINERVEVIDSKNNDIKISFVGTNGKIYDYFVKFGIDMRQNERMQRIFKILNQSLQDNSKCKKRYLSVNTYNILPLSKTVSLVECIDGVKSLKEYIQPSITDNTNLESIVTKYQSWIGEVNNGMASKSETYKRALEKYDAKTVITKMRELTYSFDWDILRKTFHKLSPSVEHFFKLQLTFIRNYATMCTVHWLTGVGDRRLENTLIEIQTGRCFGIDFLLVFDAGISLPVPEFVPFRLTTQILGLLRPYTEHDLFATTMCHVLRTLRDDKNLISAIFNGALRESSDWNSTLKEQLKKDNLKSTGVKWSPKRKLKSIQKKLSGVKPSVIIAEELLYIREQNDDDDSEDDQHFKLCEVTINGTDADHKTARSFKNDNNLTLEEQVHCLLDHAVDFNLLGRMSVDWNPFI